MDAKYKPFGERTPDYQYQNILKKILEEGVYKKHPYQKNGRLTIVTTPKMIFPLSNGAPLITERKISFWRKAVAEIICFIHGARTLDDMERIAGKDWPSWWGEWVDEDSCAIFGLPEGDLGPGSYGPAFHDFPKSDGGSFNQVEAVVKQIKRWPDLSTHKISTWIPNLALQDGDGKRQVVVAPCHGDVQITILDGKLYLQMDQRSADVPIGVPSNMIQYTALTLMFAQVTGYEPYMFIHNLRDAQIYDNQVDYVKEVILREPRPFPTLRITEPNIKNIFDFRPEHFELDDYYPHTAIPDIPVTK